MKKLLILFAAAMILSSCSVGLYTDGVHTSTVASLNLSMQPSWGPAGYNYAPYYYFPEFDFYYDVNKAIFYYLNHGRWIAAKHLPPHYPKDLHRYYKVVLTQRNPWLHNSNHRTMYKKYKGVYNQPVIGDKHKPQGPAAPKPQSPQSPQRPPQNNRYDHNKAPQNSGQNGGGSYYGSRNNQQGYGNYDNRNTVRDSRNNDTNRGAAYNNGANGSQRGNSSNSGYNRPSNQSQPNNVAPSNNRGSNNSRSQQTKASSASSEKKSSSTTQRGSSNSQSNHSTGSRGR